MDPNASCVDDDDDITFLASDDLLDPGDTTINFCRSTHMADANCNPENNNEDCGGSLRKVFP